MGHMLSRRALGQISKISQHTATKSKEEFCAQESSRLHETSRVGFDAASVSGTHCRQRLHPLVPQLVCGQRL